MNVVQAVKDVELHKPVKVALQQDADGFVPRWVEITVDGARLPAPPVKPPRAKDRRDPP